VRSPQCKSSFNDCPGPGITRGLTQPVFYELARPPSSRLFRTAEPAQSLLRKISFKITDATVGRPSKLITKW
jgi:hypothetical protein